MLTLEELLQQAPLHGLEWQVQGDLSVPITCLAPLDKASEQAISFLSNPKFFNCLATTKAAAVIMPQQGVDAIKQFGMQAHYTIVVCENPYLMFARLSQFFDQQRLQHLYQGVHPTAVVDPSATIGSGVALGPNVVVGAHAMIGDNTVIGANTVIQEHVHIGTHCLIYPQVSLYHHIRIGDRCTIHSGAVIGADGFGFAPDPTNPDKQWSKIAQLGAVHIGDDVEIGANTTIDRGALEDTIIGDDVIIDNLVMVAHNVHIGKHTAIAGCAAIAGSTHIGERCTIAGAAMIAGHLQIADQVDISGGTSVMSDVTESGRHTSVFPLMPHRQWQKNAAVLTQLSQLRQRLRQLEKEIQTGQ